MEVVGRGGYSLVYRAFDRTTDEEVAVKVLFEYASQKEELETRLEREYLALIALEGTAALRALGLCRQSGSLCLVMEFLRGQDFDAYLTDIADQGLLVDPSTLVEFIGPIVETLDVAHRRGIVHRDIKPGNAFILGRGGPGGVRLLDFGLSFVESATPITRDGVVIGSPSYIAPEVWEGHPRQLDHRVDVYSLGAVLFRALAGRVPFPEPTLREKLEAVTAGKRPSLYALRPDLPAEIDSWVARALAIDRTERFPSVRDMWDALLVLLGVGARQRVSDPP
jgi:serine/threonine-protein kinase